MSDKLKYKVAYMDMAERFAQTSEAERLKVGCLIVKNEKIISLGVNGTPPKWPSNVCEDEHRKTFPHVRHAEDAALQKLWCSAETSVGADMYITHQPCINCAIKIVTAGISMVYYRYEYRSKEGVEWLIDNNILCVKL